MSKYFYFFVYYQRTAHEDADDLECVFPENKELKPLCIHNEESISNKIYYYKKIFKAECSSQKNQKANNYLYIFETGDYKFIIKLDTKGNTYVYDVSLEIGKRRIKIIRNVPQNIIEYYKKMDFFEEALKKNGEENQIDDLYKETIGLYKKKKGFSLLISLFLKVYNKKDLCKLLFEQFRIMNENPKDIQEYNDRKSYLKQYIENFNDICSEAEKLIDCDEDYFINYYGIILCYLNFYDYNKFSDIVKKLSKSNPKRLYEIMLIFSEYFKNPINENYQFYNNFVKYAILNKDFPVFQNGLKYITDLETFINVIDENKDSFYDRYLNTNDDSKREKCILKLDKNLKIKNKSESKDNIDEKEEEPESIIKEGCIIKEKNSLAQIKKQNDKKVEKRNKNSTMAIILKKINSIIKFENETENAKKIFFIYFTNDFWKYLMTFNSEPNMDNIYFCSLIRETFIKYYNLVIEVFEKKAKFTIKNEAISYFERDEFAFILNQMIKEFILDKKLTNIEKLAFITQYNPYYYEEKYFNTKVDAEIFDIFNLNSVDEDFIFDFRGMYFEKIFEKNLHEYVNKIVSKIESIENFDVVIKLFNIENISEKDIFLEALNKKYDTIIMPEIGALSDKKLNEAIYITAKIAIINFIYEKNDEEEKDLKNQKKFNFINFKIKKLNKEILPLIFIEIIKLCIEKETKQKKEKNEEENEDADSENHDKNIPDDDGYYTDFKDLKDFIFNEFIYELKSDKDIDNIINLLNCLEGKYQKQDDDKENTIKEEKETTINKNENIINEFLGKLLKINLFTKEQYFKNEENFKIKLVYKLYIKGKIKKNDEDYYKNIVSLLEDIKKDLIDENIQKRKLDQFLSNDKTIIEERLELIKIILDTFKQKDTYDHLTKVNNEITEYINNLKKIKDNIILYYKETYQNQIKQLTKIINDNKNKKILQYRGDNLKNLFVDNDKLAKKSEEINKVKNFLLFTVIYDMNCGKDETSSFNNAYKILEDIGTELNKKSIIELYNNYTEIFDEIKKKLSNNEERAQQFIQDFIKYYEIKDPILIDELTILFKIKKYELDINSMIEFFDYFEKDNKSWNKKLSREEYENLSETKELSEIKSKLLKLKENNIYDYQNIANYYKLFTCLYKKKEAVEFLFLRTPKDIEDLKDNIQPTDRTISIKDINDTKECNSEITRMKKIENNDTRFAYIQSMNKETITKFENYSKIYESVIELYNNDEDSDNLYDQVRQIIEDATFNIFQDSEKFFYGKDSKDISKKKLIRLKNRIQIKGESNKNEQNDIISNTGEDKLEIKRKILLFYKNIISNLEVILEYMKVLRNKGSSLPIKIQIKVKINNKNEPSISYSLEKEKNVSFEKIRNFLFDAKTSYISQLEEMYKEKLNLRFLYGKQFRSFSKHLVSNVNMDSFLRYILNITDNDTKIIEGFKSDVKTVNDYISYYSIYNHDSLENISKYITSLFEKNGKTIEDHYNKMRIIPSKIGLEKSICSVNSDHYVTVFERGIYLYELNDDRNSSMEEFIINIFWDKINELPIAQNVLITNKETSIEEIQAFFHRAILCNYNTLFVVEINDSFSDFQQSKMNNYIDSLLSYKNKRFNEDNNKNIDKTQTEDYLDSCIIFVYDNNNKNITSFLKEIRKLKPKSIKYDKLNDIDKNKNKGFKSELENIMIVNSEICGLGKSEKIKNIIKEKNKKYYHFPLGGILTRNYIFDKLQNLLKKFKNEKSKDIAIHLDLTESKEKSIINEFFFSFLITKFYTNNENIIYIPKDISIYIEIPNCFDDYLSKFGILNIFNKETIEFKSLPPFNYSDELVEIFTRMRGYKTNKEIENFVKEHIGIKKYSYHQINIFIKLFISQYSKFDSKIYFYSVEKDVTEERIKQFALFTQYFTNGGFAELLIGNNEEANKLKDYIDKLSVIYDNDLHRDFPTPLIFIIKEKMIYDRLYIPTKNSNEYKSSRDYLKRIKKILNLPNAINADKGKYVSLLSIIEDENNNYVITNDNFKKMVLLVYRIKANVPVIIMGDTGCGKTALITKLNQILNNGKTTVEIINIHPGITDEKLCKIMEEKNKIAEKILKEKKEREQKKKNNNLIDDEQIINDELWIFFDEINTCLSMSLLTEIFINRTYNGNKLCDNIRLIGACNPYRKRKGEKEKCGLSKSDDNENELVYIVEPLPQSLLYYVFSFGSIDDYDEKKYIFSIIEKLFLKEKGEKKQTEQFKQLRDIYKKTKEELKNIREDYEKEYEKDKNASEKKLKNLEEKILKLENKLSNLENERDKITSVDLHILTTEAISQCHIYLRNTFDPSVVSLREIARFVKCVEFFKNYFEKKNKYLNRENKEKNNKLRSIICSIYLCYYIRLTDESKRTNFEIVLRPLLIKLINNDKFFEETDGNLLEQIKNEELNKEILRNEETIDKFSDFLMTEEDFILDLIDLDKGIGKNTLLKENVLLLFLSVITNIPLIIIGKPGTGKSLSAQLIYKSLRGKYSKNEFFRLFPKLIQIYFQGSESTDPDDVLNLFDRAKKKLNHFIKENKKIIEENEKLKKENKKEKELEELPTIMVLFDELGLAERSKKNPLKVLHSKLEYLGKDKGVSFIGISNYTLDAAKINRALVLSVPDLDQRLDEIVKTSENIVESISENLKKEPIFKLLSKTYFDYKNELQFIKELVVYNQYKKDNNNKNKIIEDDIITNVNKKKKKKKK